MKTPCKRADLGRVPLVMGILNVTPDSFSDGGSWTDPKYAVKHAFDMVDQGADIIDIGAESTRPGSGRVPVSDELDRLIPVLKDLIPSISVPVSLDTMKPEVARAGIDLGVDIVNDVNGLRSEGMVEACCDSDVSVVIGHMYGDIGDVHSNVMGPDYREEIRGFLYGRCDVLSEKMSKRRIIIDPGLGFGKTSEQNMEIAKDCSFLGKEYPILVGASRKRFVREYYPDMDIDDASVKVAAMAVASGAGIVRVHDVGKTVTSLRL